MAAIAGSHSRTRVDWSSTMLSTPHAGWSMAASIAVATSWACVKENIAPPSPMIGILPARNWLVKPPSGAKLEPGP